MRDERKSATVEVWTLDGSRVSVYSGQKVWESTVHESAFGIGRPVATYRHISNLWQLAAFYINSSSLRSSVQSLPLQVY